MCLWESILIQVDFGTIYIVLNFLSIQFNSLWFDYILNWIDLIVIHGYKSLTNLIEDFHPVGMDHIEAGKAQYVIKNLLGTIGLIVIVVGTIFAWNCIVQASISKRIHFNLFIDPIHFFIFRCYQVRGLLTFNECNNWKSNIF